MKAIPLFIFLAQCPLFAQNRLDIQVEGVESSTGVIRVALFSSREGFLKEEHVYRHQSARAEQGITHLRMEDLPEGTYALAVFHDLNENKKLDTNWVGIPKEPMGFSNARMKTFGPPRFEECRIDLRENRTISVKLE